MDSHTIAIHSFKGGSGKSLLASALAHALSKSIVKGRILLLDCDFLAPSIHSFFGLEPNSSNILQFLVGDTSISDIIINTQYQNLDIILAPSPSKGKEILKMDAKWHAKALQNMLEAIAILTRELDYKWIIFDNQSGVSMSSINFLTLSSSSIILLRPSKYAIEGVLDQSKTIFNRLSLLAEERPRIDYLVWNQVPAESNDKDIFNEIESWNKKFIQNNIVPIGYIPYDQGLAKYLFLSENYDLNELIPHLAGVPEKIIKNLTELRP